MAQETEVLDINSQIAQRKQKLFDLRQEGNAFPNDFRPDQWAADLHQKYGNFSTEELESANIQVKVAGRIMMRRLMGKASFVSLQDTTGRIQLYIRQDDVPAEVYEKFKHWDLGDIIGAQGSLFKTKTGELSVKCHDIRMLTKSLRPLPDKFHGLTDTETRYRQRYLDLMVNEESRRVFRIRSGLINSIRRYLTNLNYLEVETPMLVSIAGGAAARPFVTHHNTLDMELYLRIAPELFLKRLVVGGFDRVFEINRNFRNEGISTRHNPEFTMIEFYQAHSNYHELMDLTEDLLRTVAKEVLGTTSITYQGVTTDLAQPFTRMTMRESILAFNPDIKAHQIDDEKSARELLKTLDISVPEMYGLGKIQVEIFDKLVEHRLLAPTFITAYPTEVSPLARKNDENPFVTDRFEFFVAGQEIANGFSELNDAEDQADRLIRQVEEKNAGDIEAMPYDEDYVVALEYGMPPTAGEGIGIDRLTMLFTDSASIRDVILFPLLRPQAETTK